jgi:hypothetical protein
MSDIYSSGEYLEATNQAWHTKDSPWKADQIFRIIRNNSIHPKNIAEIGCGAGQILSELSKQSCLKDTHFEGYDISHQAIEFCEKIDRKNCKYFCKDLLVEDSSKYFDILLVIDVFEHDPDYLGFVEKCRQRAEYKIYHIPLEINVLSTMRNNVDRCRYLFGHLHYFTANSAIATLKDTGHEIIDYFYTNSTVEVFKNHPTTKKAIANVPRWLFSKFSVPFTAKVFGGYSLLVLANKAFKNWPTMEEILTTVFTARKFENQCEKDWEFKMKFFNKFIFFSIIVFAICNSPGYSKTYKLFYLGGQSNMDGYGKLEELPKELNKPVNGVKIFHGNTADDCVPADGRGLWTELKPGHGRGFTSDGKTNSYSDRFGVELTFAKRLKELLPDENIALVKYSKGGTSIHIDAAANFGCWDPDFNQANGVNQFDHFLATINYALSVSDIDGDGEKDKLVPTGILWMQGESDANKTIAIAQKYEQNLKRLMDIIRAVLRVDDLPVIIGRISDSGTDDDGKVWDYGNIVRACQTSFVIKDGYADIVTTTDRYNYSDKWHYNGAGYIDFGIQFADTMFKLIK